MDTAVTAATGTAERDAALDMLGASPAGGRKTAGGEGNFGTRDFVHRTRAMGITPHVTQFPETERRGSAIDVRTTRHPGYDISQRKRNWWSKRLGG